MHEQNGNASRRQAIVKILRDQPVGKQAELVRLLKRQGYEATHRRQPDCRSLVSADRAPLRAACGPTLPDPQTISRRSGGFVREIKAAGSTIRRAHFDRRAQTSRSRSIGRVARGGRNDFR